MEPQKVCQQLLEDQIILNRLVIPLGIFILGDDKLDQKFLGTFGKEQQQTVRASMSAASSREDTPDETSAAPLSSKGVTSMSAPTSSREATLEEFPALANQDVDSSREATLEEAPGAPSSSRGVNSARAASTPDESPERSPEEAEFPPVPALDLAQEAPPSLDTADENKDDT